MDNKEVCNITGIECSHCEPCCGNKAITYVIKIIRINN